MKITESNIIIVMLIWILTAAISCSRENKYRHNESVAISANDSSIMLCHSADEMCRQIIALSKYYKENYPIHEFTHLEDTTIYNGDSCLSIMALDAIFGEVADVRAYALLIASIQDLDGAYSEGVSNSMTNYYSEHPNELHFLNYLINFLPQQERNNCFKIICNLLFYDLSVSEDAEHYAKTVMKEQQRLSRECIIYNYIKDEKTAFYNFFNDCGFPLKLEDDKLVLDTLGEALKP